MEERIEVKVHTDGQIKPEDAVREACTKLNEELTGLSESFTEEMRKFQGEEGLATGAMML